MTPQDRKLRSTMSCIAWLCKSIVNTPTLSKPLLCPVVWKAEKLTPFRNTPAFPIEQNLPGCPRIAHLLFSGGPSAVLRRIRSIVVDAINFSLIATWLSHVRQKALKSVSSSPSLANCDSATAIKTVGWMRWKAAPRNDARPNTKHRRGTFTMCGASLNGGFRLKAAAAFNVTSKQIVGLDNLHMSTLTLALPMSISNIAHDRQPSKHAIKKYVRPAVKLCDWFLHLIALQGAID